MGFLCASWVQVVIIQSAREILLGGGNIHCITQQQPAAVFDVPRLPDAEAGPSVVSKAADGSAETSTSVTQVLVDSLLTASTLISSQKG